MSRTIFEEDADDEEDDYVDNGDDDEDGDDDDQGNDDYANGCGGNKRRGQCNRSSTKHHMSM